MSFRHALRAARLCLGLIATALIAGGVWPMALAALLLGEALAFTLRALAPADEAPTARAVLDPALDSVADLCVFVALMAAGVAPAWLTALLFAGELATPYLRTFALQTGRSAELRRSALLKRAGFALCQIGLVALIAFADGAAAAPALLLAALLAQFVAVADLIRAIAAPPVDENARP